MSRTVTFRSKDPTMSAQVKTFAFLGKAARHYLELAEQAEEFRLYNCMSVITYSAFMFEAYLNHIGPEVISDWEEIDKDPKRRLRTHDKIRMVLAKVGVPPKFGEDPLQSMGKAFWFRDRMAHGRTEHLEWADGDGSAFPQTEWQKEATLKNARRVCDQLHKLVRTMDELLGNEGDPFLKMSRGFKWGE